MLRALLNWVPLLLLVGQGPAYARDPRPPCSVRSRQMTLAKNCYTNDMAKPSDGRTFFFGSVTSTTPEVNYCYNSLVMLTHKPGEALIGLHLFKDGKDGQVQVQHYGVAPAELGKPPHQSAFVNLKGTKGECYSPSGAKEACASGMLQAMGFQDIDMPTVLTLGRNAYGQFALGALISNRKNLERRKVLDLEPVMEQNLQTTNERLLQDIRRRLATVAKVKVAQMRQPGMTPQRMIESSEQFRFCMMAMEGYLKDKKIPDPFSPDEKMAMNHITSFMNADLLTPVSQRLPANVPSKVTQKGKSR